MKQIALWVSVCLCAPAALGSERQDATQRPAETGPREEARSTATLDMRISAVVDLHYYVRWLAGQKPLPPDAADFADAVSAARKLSDAFGSPLAWGIIEGNFLGRESAADVLAAFSQLPEEHRMRDGTTIRLRALAVSYAEALRRIEPHFQKSVWPEHERLLAQRRAFLADRLDPKLPECFALLQSKLSVKSPPEPIPVLLVVKAPEPGAFTHRRHGGGSACFVSAAGEPDSQLFESILHEATHALDIANQDAGSALQRLRKRLSEAGLTPRDRLYRDVPHTVMFVQAAETVRRVLAPQHQDYGDVAGYYARVPEAAGIVVPAWRTYAAGEATLDATIDRIVSETKAHSDER